MATKTPKADLFGDNDTPETEPVESVQTPEPPAKPKDKPTKPAEKPGGFYVYLGPSIHGVIVSGTEFDTNRNSALDELNSAIKRFPLVANLIVPRGALPESRIKIKTPGNLLYENYNRFVRELKR